MTPLAQLHDLLAGTPLDLAGVALTLAACERPNADRAPYRRHLAEMRGAVAAAITADGLDSRIEALHAVIYGLFGYEGDHHHYDDIDNANLMAVIDRRRGIPVSLGILCLDAARAQGWPAVGLAFPGHFLIRIECAGARAIVDPFNGARTVDVAGMRAMLKAMAGLDAELEGAHYAAVDDRAILLRLQNNIRMRAFEAGDLRRTLTALETIRALAPERCETGYEMAVLQAHLGHLTEAIGNLEAVLAGGAPEPVRRHAHELLAALRRHMN